MGGSRGWLCFLVVAWLCPLGRLGGPGVEHYAMDVPCTDDVYLGGGIRQTVCVEVWRSVWI